MIELASELIWYPPQYNSDVQHALIMDKQLDRFKSMIIL